MLGVSLHHFPHQSLRPYGLHCHGVQSSPSKGLPNKQRMLSEHFSFIIIITSHRFKIVMIEPYKHWRRVFGLMYFFPFYPQLAAFCSMLFSLSLWPTNEVVAHSQIIVPHGDLQGFLCQLVQGHIILKLLCRKFTLYEEAEYVKILRPFCSTAVREDTCFTSLNSGLRVFFFTEVLYFDFFPMSGCKML